MKLDTVIQNLEIHIIYIVMLRLKMILKSFIMKLVMRLMESLVCSSTQAYIFMTHLSQHNQLLLIQVY